MQISFLIPQDSRSGGVRVACAMAQKLLCRGHSVRMICTNKSSLAWRVRRWARRELFGEANGWLQEFAGEVVCQRDPRTLHYAADEIVVAIGTYTLEVLRELPGEVIKLRYNHGFPSLELDERSRDLWALSIPTITVASTLVPTLERLAPGTVIGVVPNGVESDEYFDRDVARAGIGAVYGTHPSKSPDFLIKVLRSWRERHPELPVHVIGAAARPQELGFVHYHRLPTVTEARDVYNACRVWVVASDAEGFGLPIVEAMSCGTVVVSTDNYGAMELITPGVNGLLAERRNLDQMIARVEEAYFDEERWQTLSANGKRRAGEFTWDSAVKRMEGVLEALVRTERGRAVSS